jgi:integrase
MVRREPNWRCASMLTFVRTTELHGARWEEIDLEAAEWRIPDERVKMRMPHRVCATRNNLARYGNGLALVFDSLNRRS